MEPPRSLSLGDETIVAIITPPGQGGIAAVRLAGEASCRLLQMHFHPADGGQGSPRPFVMRYGDFLGTDRVPVDEVLAVYMPRERSYTGEEQVEVFCHGGYQVVQLILRVLLDSGARAAEPGEFTKLAFLNGRIDSTRAEAVADVIAANAELSYETAREHLLGAYAAHVDGLRRKLTEILAEVEAAIDFPEEGMELLTPSQVLEQVHSLQSQLRDLASTYESGRIIKEGYQVAIAGRPNAGKSSLFNVLLNQPRALVTPVPGTTRDYLTEWIDLGGIAVKLIDTAGLRVPTEEIERAGQALTRQMMSQVDLVLWVVDLAAPDWSDSLDEDMCERDDESILLIGNKIDVVDENQRDMVSETHPNIPLISCLTGEGIAELMTTLKKQIHGAMPDLTSGQVVTSARHHRKLLISIDCLDRAAGLVERGEPLELVAFDLRQAASAIDEITGRIYNEEILDTIFSKFCIGK